MPRQRSRDWPDLPDSTYELGYRICTEGWESAVAWRLSAALNAGLWRAVRRRPSWLCRELADAAAYVEGLASVPGKIAGWAVSEALGAAGLSRTTRKLGRVFAEKLVPKIGEDHLAVVAQGLRVLGVWLCVGRDEPMTGCPCFEALATGHTESWLEATLERHLTMLRATESAHGGSVPR